MQSHEYTVIPAPMQGLRAKGAKTPADRYALALAQVITTMAADGWEYVRAETLPSEERSGIASRQVLWHNLLVFRRALIEAPAMPLPHEAPAHQPQPADEAAAAPVAPRPAPLPEPEAKPAARPFTQAMPVASPPVTPAPVPSAPVPSASPVSPPVPHDPAPQDDESRPAGPRLGPAER